MTASALPAQGRLPRGWRRWVTALLLTGAVLLGSADQADAAPATPATPTAPEAPGSPAVPDAPADPPAEGCAWTEAKRFTGESDAVEVQTVMILECALGAAVPIGEAQLPPFDAEHADCQVVPPGLAGWEGRCESVALEDYPGGHPCWWDMTVDGQKRSVTLKCASDVFVPTNRAHMPDPPNGCRWESSSTGAAPACGDVGQQRVDCRDERNWWFDDHETMQVAETAPEWWLKEIEAESKADEGQGCKLAEHPPTLDCETRLRNARNDGVDYESPGPMPDLCWGTYPTANYELSWDDGSWNDVEKYGERVMGWVASFMFVVTKTAIQIALWLVQWGFEFDIRDYTDVTADAASRYDRRIVGPWGLDDIAWMALIGYAGYSTLRRRFGVAGGEVLMGFVLLGLATVMFENRDVYMDSVGEAMTAGSDDLLIAATDRDAPPGGALDQREEVIRPLQAEIHKSFVEEPYIYLNWGRSDLPDACKKVIQDIAATGWDGDGWPARYMGRSTGCSESISEDRFNQLVNFNKEMNGERLGAAMLTMVVGLVVAVTLSLAAVTVLLAKVMVGVLFVLTPFVMVIAVLPGLGRRLAWRWCGSAIQAFAAAWGMSFIIALMLLAVKEFLEASRDLQLYERWGLVLVVVLVAYLGRKRVVASTQVLASTVADAMTRLSPAASSWSGGTPVGVDYGQPDRIGGRAAYFGAGAAAAGMLVGGRSAQLRWQERRVARRGRNNLLYMERMRLKPQLEYRADTYAFSRRQPGSTQGTISIRGNPAGPAPPQGLRGRIAAAVGGRGGAGASPGGFTGTYRPPAGGGPQDGEMRERWEVVAKTQPPPAFLLHPWRNIGQRFANRTTMRQARRHAQGLRETPYAPDFFVEGQGHPHVNARPQNAPRPVPRGGRRWVPQSMRGRTVRQNVNRWRAPRGWH